ncbi:hypothetical protein ABZV14_05860 [Streptosporangium canum]|uniref:hypothetical protein n=1 Tax=Streptosporangium canum TaxID=324952 RepID=UPI0033AD434D
MRTYTFIIEWRAPFDDRDPVALVVRGKTEYEALCRANYLGTTHFTEAGVTDFLGNNAYCAAVFRGDVTRQLIGAYELI